jgi:transglutaminase-like putative cysteine protease
VHRELEKVPTFSIPNAVAVLESRRGDCNEHAQLLTALARSLGIPARVASGLAYLDGRFYYHAWVEVWLGDWVAVDPTWGQFPADAAHLRLVTGGLSQQAELLRVIGRLGIDVEEAR